MQKTLTRFALYVNKGPSLVFIMLSSSPNEIIRLGKRKLHLTYLKAVQDDDDLHPRKKTCIKLSITDLPDDCLSRIYQSLESSADRSYFGLVCRRLLHIRFQHINFLSLKASRLDTCLKHHRSGYSDMTLSLFFSWFPRMAEVRLIGTEITDEGLEVLAQCCASLEKVDLTGSNWITDSGISFLIQNCNNLHSLNITSCCSVTGTGFVGCPKTLTHVEVDSMFYNNLTTEGIKAIVSGGGLKSLKLSGNAVNDEAVIAISRSCPLLKVLQLKSCQGIQLEGWEAIGLYCRNLKALYVVDCDMLCDLGVQALCNGCSKLSYLFTDSYINFALDLFKGERPNVHLLMTRKG